MRRTILSILLLSILMAPVSCSMAPSRSEDVNQETTARLYHVREVIDGDTFYLEDGEKVRLIGIDAPETPHSYKQRNFYYGVEAREYLKKRIESKDVRLEFDQEERDQYGRLLAYVWLNDNLFINADLIEQGYARVVSFPPNLKYHDQLRRLEKEARKNKRGLWKK
ncbi:MAG TPA: thermonuclease family protein [Anseongella sp.]